MMLMLLTMRHVKYRERMLKKSAMRMAHATRRLRYPTRTAAPAIRAEHAIKKIDPDRAETDAAASRDVG
jgi:hypothetical protein